MKRAFTKRAVLAAVALAAIATLGGCPIYGANDEGCWRDRDCGGGYLCDDNTGVCYLPNSGSNSCARPSDCGVNETCSVKARCVSGDCSFSGCVAGYRCDSSSGSWLCVSDANGSAGAADDMPAAAGAGNDASAGAGGG